MAERDKLEPVRLVVSNAREVPKPAVPDPALPRKGGDGADPALPKGCPIEPLGVSGELVWYLDEMRQLRALKARDHSHLNIMLLFGRRSYLLGEDDFWPRFGKEGQKTGWRPELAARALMAAASRKGMWDPTERERGRGAWRGPKGELVMHCGDAILDGDGWHEPGLIGRHVYPAAPPILRPTVDRAKPGETGPAYWLRSLLGTWAWKRGELDAHLLLGWIGSALIGGALDWRTPAWVTGGSGTGKSTLLDRTLPHLFGETLVHVSDTTAAGIWQKLGRSTLPIGLDEMESEEDGRRNQGIIKLARQAASGGMVLRGGAEHAATEFVVRSSFLFTSILVPPLLDQDRNRIAILELQNLHAEKPPELDPVKLRAVGEQLLRRMVDGWGRLPQALNQYRDALMRRGHSARSADGFGTLLACADLLLMDHETDSDSADQWADRLDKHASAERHDENRDEARCLMHLVTTALPRDGGGIARRPVATFIERAATTDPDVDHIDANRLLGTYGMKVIRDGDRRAFAVANYNVELAKIFDGTHWAGRSGSVGVWVQALRRLPGAEPTKGPIYIGGANGRATLLPIELVVHRADEQEALAMAPGPLLSR